MSTREDAENSLLPAGSLAVRATIGGVDGAEFAVPVITLELPTETEINDQGLFSRQRPQKSITNWSG